MKRRDGIDDYNHYRASRGTLEEALEESVLIVYGFLCDCYKIFHFYCLLDLSYEAIIPKVVSHKTDNVSRIKENIRNKKTHLGYLHNK